MTVDLTSLYNLACDACGARARISTPTEQSREAEACNLWFPAIRDQVLASARWPEATKMQRLAQLGLNDSDDVWIEGEPKPGYAYIYAIPADCLRPQYVTDYSQFDIQHFNDESRGLHTNLLAPILVYTFRQEIISLWSAELKMAVMYGLAANICTPLTGKPSRSRQLLQMANTNIIAARETAANTTNEIQESVPDWITARGYSGAPVATRYYYPFGSLLSGVGSVG